MIPVGLKIKETKSVWNTQKSSNLMKPHAPWLLPPRWGLLLLDGYSFCLEVLNIFRNAVPQERCRSPFPSHHHPVFWEHIPVLEISS